MPSAETRIQTGNAAAYLARFCGHLAKLGAPGRFSGHAPGRHAGGGQPPAVLRVEHTADAGSITLTWGQLTLRATAGELMIRADASSQEDLDRIQDMAASRLLKFGRREDLDTRWTPVTGADC
ncbi:DUF2218 domain-containing protein [Trebonia kvetii]|nr:DUF2218 domain-containing protein [Trebonia kvetii]